MEITAHLITSLDAEAASPERLPKLNRGHRAGLNKIAPAVIFANRRKTESLAETRRRFQLDKGDAIRAAMRP